MLKIFQGIVVSTKMSKTIVAKVTYQYQHRLYKKILRRSKKYKIHLETGDVAVGDTILFAGTKPISKDKHYKFVKVVKKQGE